MWRPYMDAFAISDIVSVDMHKYGALSTYTIGRDRWKPTNFSSVGFFLGMSNSTYRVSSRRNQSCMSASYRSTFPRYTYPSLGSAMRSHRMMWSRVPPKLITSSGASCAVSSFRHIQVKSKMRRGLCTTGGMTATGESHNFDRMRTAARGETTMWPAWTCSAIS